MDRMNMAPVGGRFRPLNFSMDVMFDAADKYGSISNLLDILDKETRDSADAISWLLLRMANDAELVRRAEGYDPSPMLQDDDVIIKKPVYYQIYKAAVIEAINIAYTREVEDPKQEIDLGLMELNEKKEKAGD